MSLTNRSIAKETEAAHRAGRQTCPECGGEAHRCKNSGMHCGYPMPIDVQPEPAAAVSTEAESNAPATEKAAQSEVEVTEGASPSE